MTSEEKLSALAWEARRRGIQYGQLVANLTPEEEQKIYKKWQKAREKRATEAARG